MVDEQNSGGSTWWSDSSIRKGVLASVIASLVILLFVQPILTGLGRLLLWTTNSLWQRLSDQLYISAALGHRNDVDVIILAFVLLPLIIIPSLVLIRRIGRHSASKSTTTRTPQKRTGALVVLIYSAFGVLLSISIVVSSFVDLQLNTSFRQRLTVLAPTLSEAEIRQLEASWAAMRSQVDYEAIVTRMEVIAQTRGVVLPKPLL